MNTEYADADHAIRNMVVSISNKFELGKKDTVAILTYLIHDILTIRDQASESAGLRTTSASTPFKCGLMFHDGSPRCVYLSVENNCDYKQGDVCPWRADR